MLKDELKISENELKLSEPFVEIEKFNIIIKYLSI
jgi:hypothetical protein